MNIDDELGEIVAKIINKKIKRENKEQLSLYSSIKENEDVVDIIAEIKFSSPTQKNFVEPSKDNVSRFSQIYEEEGATAISVLTESFHFSGNISFLKKAKEKTSLPILAKGFFFEPKHLVDCKVHRADSFLLLPKLLKVLKKDTFDYIKTGKKIGLEPFIEIDNRAELNSLLKIQPDIIAINNRNIFGDLSINLDKIKLGKKVPEDIALVSASGVNSGEDIKKLYDVSEGNIDAVLVGTSIMKAESPRKKLRELVEAGRNMI